MNFVREKKYVCGKYVEIDIIHYSTQQEKRLPRCKRQNMTKPSQKNLNDKNSRRYFGMILNANFGSGDYHISATYDEEHQPKDDEAAIKELRNYIRRLKTIYRKAGVEMKEVHVTEAGHKNGRVHHHIVISGGVSRELIEKAWGRGYCNVDRLQPDKQDGLIALAKYLTKDPQGGRHRWGGSRNLAKPVVIINDNKYSMRAACRIARELQDSRSGCLMRLNRIYKAYDVTNARGVYNQVTGVTEIYLMARRI